MNKALRSGRMIKQPNMSAKDFADLSRLVKVLAQKIDGLEAVSQSRRHDEIFAKLTTLETATNGLSTGLHQELETVKQTV